ncbi:MAG: serine/threonine-protein phosphatase, partial [Polyangiaceae bacterium]|nr:serine/threonine-protein phosphatase [Polyangiaceae bacterium]
MGAPRQLDLKIDVAQLSDPGRDPNKQINEDSCGYATTKFGHLCVLCDGMGGHYGGQEASRRAIKTIFEHIEQSADGTKPVQALKQAVEMAGRRVYELGGPPENKVRPGSTVVAMLLHDAGVDVAHVGDSRAFVIRSGQIYPLTRDHSMVQAMIDAGFLTEEQAIGHPDANKITRALGMKPEVEVEVRPEPMELFPGDLLITTSDGLTDLALNKDILGATKQALASGGLDHACEQLVRMAND